MSNLIPWAIGVVASLIIGGTVIFNWDKIMIALKGKSIAVLGEHAVGKTHLINFLSKGIITDTTDYQATLLPDKYEHRRFNLKDLELNIHELVDFSGEQRMYELWQKYFNESDVILYLFRADRIYNSLSKKNLDEQEKKDIEETKRRIRDDIFMLQKWQEEKDKSRGHKKLFFQKEKKESLIFAIGTHCDLIENFATKNQKEKNQFYQNFLYLEVEQMFIFRNFFTPYKIIFGSMESLENTEKLVYDLFNQVLNIYDK